MEPKPKNYLKNTRGKEERNYESNKGLLCKYGNRSTEISSFRCFPLDVPEMSGSCKSQKDNISSKDRQIGTVVLTERVVTLVQDQFKLLQVEPVRKVKS